MKYLTALLTLIAASAFGAAEFDTVKGWDFTGQSSVTPAQLNQLVDNATTATNKGMIIRAPFTPDVALNPRYSNFLWLDISSGLPGTLKQYDGSSWVTAALSVGGVAHTNLAANSVVSGKIAANAVYSTNIVDGQVAADDLASGAVTNPKLGSGAVSNANIADLTITGAKLAYNTVAGTNLAAGAALDNLANNSVTGSKIGIQTINSNNIAPGVIGAVHLAAGAITSSSIAHTSVYTTNIADAAITYSKLNTNISYLTPAYMLLIDHNAVIQSQIGRPGTGACTINSNSTGNYTLSFGTAMASTNYFVFANSIFPATGNGRFINVTTNAAAAVSYEISANNNTPVNTMHMLIVYGIQ